MNKKEVKGYTLCSESIVTKPFNSIEEKQNYIDHEIDKINYNNNLDYYYLVSENDKGTDSTELELIKLSKISENSTLKHLDARTFETYKNDPLFNNNGKMVIAYRFKGVRTVSLVAIDSNDYFDEDFLSDRIHSLIVSGKMRVSAITCLRCVAESRDLEKTTEEMTRIQGNYDEKKSSDLFGMRSAVIDFVKALHFDSKRNEQYRRFRDVVLFVYRKDAILKEQEVIQHEVQPIEPIVVPDPIDVIGEHVTQTSLFGGDVAVIKFNKAGKQAKRQ